MKIIENIKRPLLSIVCLTYNHENYIKKCLDGFVNQITNFNFEIIIHDDASNDRTVEIIRSYEIKYPGLFKNIYQSENQYNKDDIHIWLDIVFPHSQGKYIALCDGDDYWTDLNKLQKQVDFLESNLDFVLCYHNTNILVNESFQEDYFIEKNISQISCYNDLLCFGNYIQTSSVVFVNKFKSFPFEKKIQLNDYILWFWISQFGKIYRFNESMSVYRIGSGLWSTLGSCKQIIHTVNNLHEAMKIVKNDSDVIILDNKIKSLYLSLLPIELQKKNNAHYDLKEFLSKNINISVLLLSALNKFLNKIFRVK